MFEDTCQTPDEVSGHDILAADTQEEDLSILNHQAHSDESSQSCSFNFNKHSDDEYLTGGHI